MHQFKVDLLDHSLHGTLLLAVMRDIGVSRVLHVHVYFSIASAISMIMCYWQNTHHHFGVSGIIQAWNFVASKWCAQSWWQGIVYFLAQNCLHESVLFHSILVINMDPSLLWCSAEFCTGRLEFNEVSVLWSDVIVGFTKHMFKFYSLLALLLAM